MRLPHDPFSLLLTSPFYQQHFENNLHCVTSERAESYNYKKAPIRHGSVSSTSRWMLFKCLWRYKISLFHLKLEAYPFVLFYALCPLLSSFMVKDTSLESKLFSIDQLPCIHWASWISHAWVLASYNVIQAINSLININILALEGKKYCLLYPYICRCTHLW